MTGTTAVNLTWLSNLTKPFFSLLNPIAERIGNWFGRRKPRLHVHFDPSVLLWGMARQSLDPAATEMMHATFCADFNHDDPKETLLITSAYPAGTRPQVKMLHENFAVPPRTIVHKRIDVIVLPVKGTKGKPWTGRFIMVDQFERKYKTRKVTFRWIGPLE